VGRRAGQRLRHRDSGGGDLRLKDSINKILAEHTGKKVKQIVTDSDRDHFMSSEEAKKYGLVDEVVKSRKDVASLKDKKKKK